jgi:hypothetical protein
MLHMDFWNSFGLSGDCVIRELKTNTVSTVGQDGILFAALGFRNGEPDQSY